MDLEKLKKLSESIREHGIKYTVIWPDENTTATPKPMRQYSDDEFVYKCYCNGVFIGRCTKPEPIEE